MKLELKHLAPYLPYGLKLEYSNTTLGMVCERQGSGTRGIYHAAFSQDRPLLHPLSRLTEPILGGKVPLIELGKMIYNEGWKVDFTVMKTETPCVKISASSPEYLVVRKDEFRISHCLTRYPEDDPQDDEDIDELIHLAVDHWMYQKLFEWHFDVFGLIEKGLAIEKPLT